MTTLGKFNKTYLEKEAISKQSSLAKGKQKYFWDPHVHGLALKITPQKAVYIVQRRVKTPDGEKNTRIVIGGYREMTVEDAQDRARELLKDMRSGIDPIAEKKAAIVASKTLQELLDEYLDRYGSKLRPKTKDVYRKAIERCLPDWLSLQISAIDEDMVADKQLELSTHKGKRSNSDGAKAQANQTMRVLRTLFNYARVAYKDAKKQPIVSVNPIQTLKPRRLWNENKVRKELIDDDDLATWYCAVMQLDNTTVRDYLLLCLFTGLRRTEAAKLTWDNVRLQGKKPTLRIPAADTKTNSEHMLPLSSFLVALLERRDKTKGDKRYVFPGEKPDSYIVEPKRIIDKVIELTQKAQAEEGIEKPEGVDFSMHVLRRTFGTITGRLDIGYYKHKMLMNHSVKTDVTGANYVEMTVEDLREPMQKITDHLLAKFGIRVDDFIRVYSERTAKREATTDE